MYKRQVRAYAINSAGTGYGDPKTFTTTNTGNFTLNVYVVGTGSVTDNFGGINCGTDCSDVYIPGTIITLTATPASSFTSWGVGITGCSTNPVCTFTINANTSVVATFGTGTIVIPTVTTSPVTEITETTAKSGGTITNTGGQNANLSGIVWSLATDPVLDFNTYDGMTTDGWASGGPWVSNITGLVANTNYKVRAYARNSAGIGYGQVITFTSGGGVLTITTDPVTQITETTALGGGVVSNPGPGAYRGLAWGLNTNPVFNNNWWDLSGTGSGHFSLVMGNNQSSHNPLLLPNTHYHVRAFVSSGMNFVYGNEVTFTTAVGTPSCDSGSFIKGTSGSYNFSFDSIPGFPCTGTIAIKIFGAGGGGGGGSGGDGAMRGTSNPHPGIGTGSGGGGGGEGGAIGFLMPLTASTPNIVFSGTVGAGGSGGDGGSAGWHAGDGGNSGGETTLIGSNGTNITALGGAYGVGSGIFGFDSFAGLGGVGGSVSGVSSIVGAIEEQTFFINGANGNNGQAAWVEPHCYSNGGHGGEVNEPQTGGDGGLGGGAKQGGCVPPGEAGDGGNSGQQTYASGGGGGGGGGMGTRMWMFPGWYFVENYSAGGGGSGANGKVQITWFGN